MAFLHDENCDPQRAHTEKPLNETHKRPRRYDRCPSHALSTSTPLLRLDAISSAAHIRRFSSPGGRKYRAVELKPLSPLKPPTRAAAAVPVKDYTRGVKSLEHVIDPTKIACDRLRPARPRHGVQDCVFTAIYGHGPSALVVHSLEHDVLGRWPTRAEATFAIRTTNMGADPLPYSMMWAQMWAAQEGLRERERQQAEAMLEAVGAEEWKAEEGRSMLERLSRDCMPWRAMTDECSDSDEESDDDLA